MSIVIERLGSVEATVDDFVVVLHLAEEPDEIEAEILERWPNWSFAGVDDVTVDTVDRTIEIRADTNARLANGVHWLLEKGVIKEVEAMARKRREDEAEARSRVIDVLERNGIPTE